MSSHFNSDFPSTSELIGSFIQPYCSASASSKFLDRFSSRPKICHSSCVNAFVNRSLFLFLSLSLSVSPVWRGNRDYREESDRLVKCHLQAAELGQTDYFYNLSTGECNNTHECSCYSHPTGSAALHRLYRVHRRIVQPPLSQLCD